MSVPPVPIVESPGARFLAFTLAAGSVLTSALWVSICASAPEFIWRGAEIALGHLDMATVLSALLIGLILAFFVEPLMRQLQIRIEGNRRSESSRSRHPLFAAGLGLAFAFTSVCVHDAMTAYMSSGDAGHAMESAGLAAGISLTVAWAIVPFATTLAWMSRESRRLRVPMGLVAAASAGLAGWLFGWTVHEIISTVIPCLLILVVGYWQLARDPKHSAFARCARGVVAIAIAWLIVAAVADAVAALFHLGSFRLYPDITGLWMDARFYLGWALGLVLAPFAPSLVPGEDADRPRSPAA